MNETKPPPADNPATESPLAERTTNDTRRLQMTKEEFQRQVSELIVIPDPLSPNTVERCQRLLTKNAKAKIEPRTRALRRSTRARKQRQYLEVMEYEDEDVFGPDEAVSAPEVYHENVGIQEDRMEAKEAALSKNATLKNLPTMDMDDDDTGGSYEHNTDESKFKLAKKPAPTEVTTDEAFLLPPPPTCLERQTTLDELMNEAMPLGLSPGVTDWYRQGILPDSAADTGMILDNTIICDDHSQLIMDQCRALISQWPPLATQINEASVRAKDGRVIAPPLLPPPNQSSFNIEPNKCVSNDETPTTFATRRCRSKLDRMMTQAKYPQKVEKLRRLHNKKVDEAMELIQLPATPLKKALRKKGQLSSEDSSSEK